MTEYQIQIDGLEVRVKEGMTILEAAQKAGIGIPTLCHHEKLEPY
ncbi:MAG: 2Fe-2S iron-sulfur cluster-binding protein, partial [Thermodesulfobacteriota bacterium]